LGFILTASKAHLGLGVPKTVLIEGEGGAVQRNPIKTKLTKRNEPVIGIITNIHHPGLIEVMALAGIEFVILDAEHTTLSPETAEHLYRTCEMRGITAITRIGENSQQVIQKFLDAGSMGVFMPLINSKKDVQKVVNSVKYPPIGRRGLAGGRAADYGLGMALGDYVKMANQETMIIIQIETTDSFDNFSEIVGVEHVDGVFFGPNDISASLGHPGQARHPKVRQLIERLGKEAIAAGKIAGTIARDIEDYKYWRERGFLWFSTGLSHLLAGGVKSYLGEIMLYEETTS
jgi:4-hydroxy-2-oxoheptanedioate aldolase